MKMGGLKFKTSVDMQYKYSIFDIGLTTDNIVIFSHGICFKCYYKILKFLIFKQINQ